LVRGRVLSINRAAAAIELGEAAEGLAVSGVSGGHDRG